MEKPSREKPSRGKPSREKLFGEKPSKEKPSKKSFRERQAKDKPVRGNSPLSGDSNLFMLPDEEVEVSPKATRTKTPIPAPGSEEPFLAEIPRTADEEIFASCAMTADEEDVADAVCKRTLELIYLNERRVIRVTGFPFEIGREGRDCRIDPSKGKVSRRHAVLRRDGERFQICDVSKLGTALNGKRLPRDTYVDLADGMRIDMKGEIFEVRIIEG